MSNHSSTHYNIDQYKHGWKQYLTHYNYSKPFRVWISNDSIIVHIYKLDEFDSSEMIFIGEFHPIQIFIGESEFNKMTHFSGGHGSQFDGNSILLYMGDHKYVYIGKNIYSFICENEIVKYWSPIGNNDVPYPYTLDSEGYYYLMTEYACMKIHDSEDPYQHYYKMIQIPGIQYIDIEGEEYFLTTHPSPSSHYDDLTQRLGSTIYIKYDNQEKRIISRDEFIQLLSDYNKTIGLNLISHIEVIT